jgi:hypothetical protein
VIFGLIGTEADLGRDSIFTQRKRTNGMLQVLNIRFDLVRFDRLMIFFVERPVKSLAWFAAVVPAKSKLF